MNNKLYLLFLLLVAHKSIGQSESNILKGEILEFQKPIYGVHIHNLNSGQGISTLKDGTFLISVQLKDTLSISHVKYRPLKVTITKEHLEKKSMLIYMDEITNQLDIVYIKNHNLTGNLTIDSKSVPRVLNKDSIIEELIRLSRAAPSGKIEIDKETPPIVVTDPILRTMGVTGGGGPGGSPAMAFRFKDLEIRRELRTKRKFPREIIAAFGISYFTKTLKIPKDKVHLFITYCEHQNIAKLYNKNKLLKLLTILEEESIEFLKTID